MKLNISFEFVRRLHIVMLALPILGFVYIFVYTIYSTVFLSIRQKYPAFNVNLMYLVLTSIWQGVSLATILIYTETGKWIWEFSNL